MSAQEAPRLYFHRHHIPSGSVYIGPFNASHHWMLGDPVGVAWRSQLKAAQECMDRWNRQQRDTWRYRLASAEEVTQSKSTGSPAMPRS